jgi:hypothetical protein
MLIVLVILQNRTKLSQAFSPCPDQTRGEFRLTFKFHRSIRRMNFGCALTEALAHAVDREGERCVP